MTPALLLAAVLLPLGEAPLCEPSAALPAPWDARTVLVADNEVDDSLFAFALREGLLEEPRRIPLPPEQGPADIEAVAASGNHLAVVGSFSRNKDCETKVRRHRILLSRWDPAAGRLAPDRILSAAWPAAGADVPRCLRTLFTAPPPAGSEAACRALVDAEARADAGRDCATLSIEGAVYDRSGRLWLGLRSPRAADHALLLRLVPGPEAFRFDGVATADLGGLGIRELALSGDMLWGIAGPGRDGPPFRLWRVPAADLRPGARLRPVVGREPLPEDAEGMVFTAAGATVVVDGDRGSKKARTCLVPGRQAQVALP